MMLGQAMSFDLDGLELFGLLTQDFEYYRRYDTEDYKLKLGFRENDPREYVRPLDYHAILWEEPTKLVSLRIEDALFGGFNLQRSYLMDRMGTPTMQWAIRFINGVARTNVQVSWSIVDIDNPQYMERIMNPTHGVSIDMRRRCSTYVVSYSTDHPGRIKVGQKIVNNVEWLEESSD